MLRNRLIDFDETRNIELPPEDHPPAKFHFDTTMWVVSANTQFVTVRFLSLSLPHASKVLFLALCDFLFVCETNISETIKGFASDSQGRCIWFLARTSLNVKVKGQRSKSSGTKPGKTAESSPLTMHCNACNVRCKPHATGDGTSASQPGVTGWRECTLTAWLACGVCLVKHL